MSGAIDANAKPLPVVLEAARDELLSSWLARHARFYGVTGSFFAKWLGLGDFRLSALDYRLGLEQVARLTEKFRCDPVTLIGMTQINTLDGQVCSLISRGRPLQMLPLCGSLRSRRRGRRHSKTLEQGVANYMPRLRPRLYRLNRASRQSCDAPRDDSVRRPMVGGRGRRANRRAIYRRRKTR